MTDKQANDAGYIKKVWQTVGILAFVTVLILAGRVILNVLLLCLAGSLIAVYFHGLGGLIQRFTHWRRLFCMMISIAGTFILMGALFWFMGSKIQVQIAVLSNTLPATFTNFKQELSQSPIFNKLPGLFQGDNSGKLVMAAQRFFTAGFGVLGNMFIILFLGIFFTASPSLYKDGIILLVPKSGKPVAQTILDRCSHNLRGWLKATGLNMVMVAIVLPIGLYIMNVPVALVLGLLAAILTIVPNFGSAAAMVPGVLLALTISPETAVIVAIIYIGVQTLAGNIISPIIQKRMINLPPALTLVAQLLMGALGGVMGIILAIPVLVIAMILVDELYVKRINVGE